MNYWQCAFQWLCGVLLIAAGLGGELRDYWLFVWGCGSFLAWVVAVIALWDNW